MTNALTLPGGAGLVSREDLAKSLNNAAMSMPAAGSNGKAFLKMDKGNGDWLFGQEETVVEEESLWAINPTSLMHGYIAWDTDAGGAPVQEVMVPISRPLPVISSLPPLGVSTKTGKQLDYKAQRSVDLVCIHSPSGEDQGTVVEYKQGSVGAMKLFAKITNDLLTQLDKGNDIVAIVKLRSDSYKHKQYGRIYNPEWPVQEWRPMDDTSAPGADEDEADAPEAKAEAKAPAKAETKAAPEADDAEADDVAAEYAAEQAKAEGEAAPRRRMRRA